MARKGIIKGKELAAALKAIVNSPYTTRKRTEEEEAFHRRVREKVSVMRARFEIVDALVRLPSEVHNQVSALELPGVEIPRVGDEVQTDGGLAFAVISVVWKVEEHVIVIGLAPTMGTVRSLQGKAVRAEELLTTTDPE